jgi:hypothetical protein
MPENTPDASTTALSKPPSAQTSKSAQRPARALSPLNSSVAPPSLGPDSIPAIEPVTVAVGEQVPREETAPAPNLPAEIGRTLPSQHLPVIVFGIPRGAKLPVGAKFGREDATLAAWIAYHRKLTLLDATTPELTALASSLSSPDPSLKASKMLRSRVGPEAWLKATAPIGSPTRRPPRRKLWQLMRYGRC